MPAADARSEARVSNYTKFWQKDSAKDGEEDRSNRLEKYTDLVNGYYDGATELYEYGWGEWPATSSCEAES
jgi:sterol 24-C-methyltransferase